MTFEETMLDLRNLWSDQSKDETNQTKLFEYCEQFIADMDQALVDFVSHPPPPPPRVR